MHIRGAGHPQVSPHAGNELRVVPIGAFCHISLFAPCFGKSVGQVAIPVIKAEVHPAHQLKEAAATCVADHRHGGNRRKAYQTVGPVLFYSMDVGCRDDLQRLLPLNPAEASLASGLLPCFALFRILLDHFPCVQRITGFCPGFPVKINQFSTDQGIFYPQGTIEVPRKRDSPLASSRLIRGKRALQQRVIHRLGLPDDDPVFHMHIPAAAARAVDSMGTSNHFVVRKTVTVKLLPFAGLG